MLKKNPSINCTGCGACATVCPKDCIRLTPNAEGFLCPVIDEDKCIGCHRCTGVCPSLQKPECTDRISCALAIVNRDSAQHRASSSGGVFVLLATEIIARGGVVFGAAFTEDFGGVEHVAVSKVEELRRIMQSKYLQSRIGDSYREAKRLLDAGAPVLFTGTPCQIAGLLRYLGREYDNLYTQDFVCHGVPSPEIWRRYLTYLEKKKRSRAVAVEFRNKRYGWGAYHMLITFANGKTYRRHHGEDPYMRGFLADIYLRPSCHRCDCKGAVRPSDITLADFWGVAKAYPELYNAYGTSLVLAHSERGRELLAGLKNVTSTPVDLDVALRYNTAALTSATPSPRRDAFWDELSRRELSQVLRGMFPDGPVKKAKRVAKRVVFEYKRLFRKL